MDEPTRIPAYELGYSRGWLAMPFDTSTGPIFEIGTEAARDYLQGYADATWRRARRARRARRQEARP